MTVERNRVQAIHHRRRFVGFTVCGFLPEVGASGVRPYNTRSVQDLPSASSAAESASRNRVAFECRRRIVAGQAVEMGSYKVLFTILALRGPGIERINSGTRNSAGT